MPMQLPNAPLRQMLLRARNIMTARQIRNDLFPDPSTPQQSRFAVRKTPLQVHNQPVVRALTA